MDRSRRYRLKSQGFLGMFLENWENWGEWSEDEGQVEKGQRKTNLAPLRRYRGGRRRAEEGLKPGVKLGRCLLGAQVPPCLRRLLHRRSRAAIMGRKGFARIVILAGFQDPMHQMQQFAHDGYHDAHARLATCLELGSPLPEIGVAALDGERTHVEPLAHQRVALFRDGGLAMHRGARLLLGRTQPGMSHQLGRAIKALLIEKDRVQTHGRQARDARDRVQVRTGLTQLAMFEQQVVSALQRMRTLRLEPVDMLLDLLAGEGIQAMVLQAVALLAGGHLHRLMAPQQHLQLLHLGRRRTPERRAFLRAEAGQHQRIMAIRFGADAFTRAEGGDASGIDHTDLMALFKQEASNGIGVGAGGFQTGMNPRQPLSMKPALQLGKALGSIGQALGQTPRLALAVYADIQREFGHIDAHSGQGLVHPETPFSQKHVLHYQQRRGAGLRIADRPCPSKFIPCRLRAGEDFRYRSIFERSNEKAIASTSQAQGLGAGTDSSLLVSASRSLLVYLISSLIIQGAGDFIDSNKI